MDLGAVARLPALSRRVMDARPLPHLRSPHRRLRRLPLPGFSAHRRCRRHRPGVFACAHTSFRRSNPAADEHRTSTDQQPGKYFSTAKERKCPTNYRRLALPQESRISSSGAAIDPEVAIDPTLSYVQCVACGARWESRLLSRGKAHRKFWALAPASLIGYYLHSHK